MTILFLFSSHYFLKGTRSFRNLSDLHRIKFDKVWYCAYSDSWLNRKCFRVKWKVKFFECLSSVIYCYWLLNDGDIRTSTADNIPKLRKYTMKPMDISSSQHARLLFCQLNEIPRTSSNLKFNSWWGLTDTL